ncbi:Dehydrodolichyl diphosphate synthase complex subunit NUS1 [Cladobotryum mycophilum]|uniref:ditrans,polycis-polyprenyl diphosphate synthase [(2E,6E)-farnesyldiphosphate specific] n=1 Tax=Cladobotryum mycophilum TaxID=491253 RepID=A0ABR0SB00_9HYPO
MLIHEKPSPSGGIGPRSRFYHTHLDATLHALGSIYLHTRQTKNIFKYKVSALRLWNITAQRVQSDIAGLSKKPKHLSAILRIDGNAKANALERLIDETAELAAWSACAEIDTISVYEKTGLLKDHMHRVYEAVTRRPGAYFLDERCPSLSVVAPHKDEYTSALTDEKRSNRLQLYLISEQDGREPILDLAKSLAEKSQRGEMTPDDITLNLIHGQLSHHVMPEPDLLVLFGPNIELARYPPWQSRLMEIYYLQDNMSFEYRVFAKALRAFAGAEKRNGK